MPRPIKERIAKLREEIAEICEASREYLRGGKKIPGAPDHERRLQRLQRRTNVIDGLEEDMSMAFRQTVLLALLWLLAITARQDVTFLTDRTRSFVSD
jgi:hypothetical protein